MTLEERRRYGPRISIAIQLVYNILNSPNDTGFNAITGCRLSVFEYIYEQWIEEIKSMKDAPLFVIDEYRGIGSWNQKNSSTKDSPRNDTLLTAYKLCTKTDRSHITNRSRNRIKVSKTTQSHPTKSTSGS